MVSEAIKKYRDVFAFGLLAVATLYLIGGLSLLFKSEEDSFLTFPGRAAQTSYLFAHPLVIISLATAIALAVGLGQASANARGIVVSALIIGAACMVLGLVSWFASFGYDGSGFGGVITAGKIVAIFLGLAQLLALGLTLFFAVVALQSLPKRVRQQAPQWGAPQNYAQQAGWGQQPGPQQWGQQPPPQQWGPPTGQPQWGQPGGQHQGWAQPEQQQAWGQPEQQSWGQHVDPQQQAWAQPEQQQTWAQPEHAQQAWAQPEQQSWGEPEQQQQAWAQPEQQPQQQSWSEPEQQQSWGQPAEQEAQTWASAETSAAEETSVSEGVEPAAQPFDQGDASAVEAADADTTQVAEDAAPEAEEGQQDGWWQRPSQ